MQNNIKQNGEPLEVDSYVLFSRFIVLDERSQDPKPFFAHELAHEPMTLFQSGSLRTCKKALLAKAIKANAVFVEKPTTTTIVIDGGSLLHRVRWNLPCTYAKIIEAYVSYVKSHYGDSCKIVFDGYNSGPSTKDMEHDRRSNKKMANVTISNDNIAYGPQNAFLANDHNKEELIGLLKVAFMKAGHECHQAKNDGDCLIAATALDTADYEDTMVISDDTDIFIMLLYHHDDNKHKHIYWFSEASSRAKNSPSYLSIQDIKAKLSPLICKNILFLHAWFGCDTTSSIYGFGKTFALKWIENSQVAATHVSIFSQEDQSPEVIEEAGKNLFKDLYKGSVQDSLNDLRFNLYMKAITSSDTRLQPESLPPTESAAGCHSRRVYLQVQVWKKLNDSAVDPLFWGWKLQNDRLTPIMTEMALAPKELLNIVRCSCKSSDCSSKRCSCRKAGLPCLYACTHCSKNGCINQRQELGEEVEDTSVLQ